MDYQKNQKYFQPVNYVPGILILIFGLLVFVSGISTSAGMAIFGLLCAIAGGMLIAVKKKGIVTDAEYDASVSSMLHNIQAKALNKLGIDEEEVKEIAPIYFGGYDYRNASQIKKGDDGIWRADKYKYVILFFSEREVHCYTYKFNTTSQKQTEETDVYFYKNIVSVSTASDSIQVLGKNIDDEYFKLVTTGGTAFSVSIQDASSAQRSINAMRQLIKEKNQG